MIDFNSCEYQSLGAALPMWEFAIWEGESPNREPRPCSPGKVRWSRDIPPPPVGTEIIVTLNSCGPAVVTGYFIQHGWLGVCCRLHNPPDWHVKQNSGRVTSHVFGPEFRLVSEREYIGRKTPGEAGPGRVVVSDNWPNTRPLDPRYDLRNHSPDGFQWGYGGSGPSQLALALVADATGDDALAQRVYQDFKFKVVAGLGDFWRMTDSKIANTARELDRELVS